MRNKKAISVIVSYVLLVVIGISLSVLVYNWLRFYVGEKNIETCPDDINLIIQDYHCQSRQLNLTLKNKGLFSIEKYVLRVNDRVGSEIGIYVLNETGTVLAPGEEVNHIYNYGEAKDSNDNLVELINIKLIDVQPYVKSITGNSTIPCTNVASQRVNC